MGVTAEEGEATAEEVAVNAFAFSAEARCAAALSIAAVNLSPAAGGSCLRRARREEISSVWACTWRRSWRGGVH